MADPTEEIDGRLFAARKEAFQQARTTNLFKTVLLIVCVVGFVALAIYALSHSTAQSRVRTPFDNREAYNRIVELEKQLKVLKSDVAEVKEPNSFFAVAESVVKFAVTNWVLLGFVFAIATAAYVKLKFKIDYFESYRDLATKKMLSEFYRKLGDRMLVSNEWESGESAYRDSLAINPTNIKATYGIAKASVFQPLKGQQFYVPEIADAKLDYLIANSAQHAGREDFAQLYFLKSINRFGQGDEDAVREWLLKAIEVDPRYFASYLNLGFSYLTAGEIDKAIECYEKAYDLEPSFARTNNNLGACYLITARFDKAIEHLERANRTAAALITQLALGEAYRYVGRIADALRLHEIASSNIETKGIENERYTLGDWTWVFMPLYEGDTETIRQSVNVWTFPQKKMLTYYALAFDRALNGQRARANSAFNLGRDCDEAGDYNAFFVNRIESILNFVKPSPEARGWFEEKKKAFSPPAA